MQEAVELAFYCFLSGHADCRLLILRQVVKQCRGRNLVAYGVEEPGVLPKLRFLPEQDRLSLVLIDVLRLDYPNAARVTGWSFRKINMLLAQARKRITDQKKCQE